MGIKLIKVKNLKKYFSSGIFRKNYTRAVDGISFEISEKETFALVGESGCGKSTVGRCILNLIKPTSGEIYFKDVNISGIKKGNKALKRKMQIIFQDADGSLNPGMKISDLVIEPLKVHGLINGSAKKGRAREKMLQLMELVSLAPDILDRYPNELSGGQRQRVGIARAIALNPEFIVADEPAASLDLSLQAKVMELMKKLQAELGITYLFISHNLRLVRLMADKIAVMYLGRFVEIGDAKEIFNSPVHPYTRALLSAVANSGLSEKQEAIMLKGEVSDSLYPAAGCVFHTRCPAVKPICLNEPPLQRRIGSKHMVWCHFA